MIEFLLIQLTQGVVCVFFFQFRNRNKNFIHIVSFFIILIFAAIATIPFHEWGKLIWYFSGVGLLMAYALRFRKKQNVGLLDYLKLIGIASFAEL